MFGLYLVTKCENLSVAYIVAIMYKVRVKIPPRIVLTFSSPFILKVGRGYAKADIYLKTSPTSHDLLLFFYFSALAYYI